MYNNRRVRTTPVVQDLKDISIKVRGIVIINQISKKKSSIIQVKPQQKILYHCYKRYKSFIFPLDCVYDKDQFYTEKPQSTNTIDTIEKKYNYCLMVLGSKNSGLQQFSQGNTSKQGLFYMMLSPLFNRFVKNQIMSLNLNFFAINEDMVFDLVSQKTVQVRQGNDEISFHRAQSLQIFSQYQLYNSIKNFYASRKDNIPQSYFVIYGQLQQKNSKDASKRKILMIEIPNDSGKVESQEKAWNSHSLMIINQCISSLSNRLNQKSKQYHGPFRNSRVTRILKPFLTYNTKVDAIGIINSQEMHPTYQTLSLVRNIQKIRIPCKQGQNNEDYKKLYQKLLLHSQSKDDVSQTKVKQLKFIQQSGKQQLNLRLQLQKIRNNFNRLQEDSLLNFNDIITNSPQDMSLSKSLQSEEFEAIGRREKKILKVLEQVKKKRNQAIKNTKTKTQKLKMMKKFYSIQIENQQELMKQRQQEMLKIKKIYKKRLKTLDDELKKKPSQLISENSSLLQLSKQKTKRTQSLQINNPIKRYQKLPSIPNYQTNKKAKLLKNKVKKGRVQLKAFFEQNISKYQDY